MLSKTLLDGVLTLTISRPERKNALTQALLRELREALREATIDPATRVVILAAEGPVFCAGIDLNAVHAIDPEDPVSVRGQASPGWDTPEARADRILRNAEASAMLHEMPKPTIAKIRGAAVGAGLGLALACDLRYIDPTARFITGFSNVGLAGDLGVTPFLLNLVGPSRATELLFFSEPIDAQRIMQLGLANWLVEADELDARVAADARRLSEGPTLAYRSMKATLTAASHSALRYALAAEAQNQGRCLYSEDAREAARAHVEKRPAKFSGR